MRAGVFGGGERADMLQIIDVLPALCLSESFERRQKKDSESNFEVLQTNVKSS